MSEQTPLLPNARQSSCKEQLQKTACCSFKKDLDQSCSPKKKRPCSDLPVDKDDDFCYLSEQKWEYKLIALACALFLAGKAITPCINWASQY